MWNKKLSSGGIGALIKPVSSKMGFKQLSVPHTMQMHNPGLRSNTMMLGGGKMPSIMLGGSRKDVLKSLLKSSKMAPIMGHK